MPETFDQPMDPDARQQIATLIATFASGDDVQRHDARRSLIQMEDTAVGALIVALRDKKTAVRWEAAKTLGGINSPVAVPALVEAMNDRDFGVRWLAAEALISLHKHGLAQILQALIENTDAMWLWESAHHVFKMLSDKGLADLLAPILDALDHAVLPEEISQAAHMVLERLLQEQQAASA